MCTTLCSIVVRRKVPSEAISNQSAVATSELGLIEGTPEWCIDRKHHTLIVLRTRYRLDDEYSSYGTVYRLFGRLMRSLEFLPHRIIYKK
jgi:hypothetical protein